MNLTSKTRAARLMPQILFWTGLLVISSLFAQRAVRALEIAAVTVEGSANAVMDSSALTTDHPDRWHQGPTLVVSNTSLEVNGDCWRPSACIADPGPDGISLAEALWAVNAVNLELSQHETITFDPSLAGSVINVTEQLVITADGVTIDGDIDDDGNPDITLDGQGDSSFDGPRIWGASHVIIDGLHFRNFGAPVEGGVAGSGLVITNNLEDSLHHLENLSIRNCRFTNVAEAGIDVRLHDYSSGSIRNLEIVGNTFDSYFSGVGLAAGPTPNTTDNEISHVKIMSNTFGGDTEIAAISIRGADGHDASRHLVDDVEIRGNTMTGHTLVTILIDAANRNNCNDNTIRNITIAENVIDGHADTIELVSVGQTGTNSTGNLVADVAIVDNQVTGGGIAVSGATASGAISNTISGVLVERNRISDCDANAIHVYAGDSGAAGTVVEGVIARNNVIEHSTDAGILLDDRACALPGNTIDGVTITNNTVVSNGLASGWGAGGVNVDKSCSENVISGVTISNTVLWGNNLGDAIGGSVAGELSVATSILSDTRFTGSNGNVYDNPQFTAPASGDYHLGAASPAIDSGDPSGSLVGPQDFDGRDRVWDGDGNGEAVVDRGAYEYGSTTMQEIEVRGDGSVIFDGDVVPVPWDGTMFGEAFVGKETVTRTFTIQNIGGATLSLTATPKVAITGTHAADFSVTTAPAGDLSAGSETTFMVTFDPTGRGLRTATIWVENNDVDEDPYTFAIQGMGVQPEIAVKGNDVLIADGDMTPSETDSTDFGTVHVTGELAGKIYAIENTGTTTLTLTGDPAVTITGTHAADFEVNQQPSTTIGTQHGTWPLVEIFFRPTEEGLRTATVVIPNDDADENPYTFAVQGTGESVPTVGFISDTLHTAEGVGTATISVTLSVSSTETVTVGYRTAQDAYATASEGAEDGDYVATEGQLTFEPGETVETFGVEIVDDVVHEENGEWFRLELDVNQNASAGHTYANVYIEDDDPVPMVGFSAGAYSVAEDSGTVPITVTLEGSTELTATVDVSSAGGTASAGEDYVSVSDTLVFTPGVTSHVFAVEIASDSAHEDDTEWFELQLAIIQNASGGQMDAQVHIEDDDPMPTVGFSAGTYSVGEEEGTAPITVTLQGATALTATVEVTGSEGTATAGDDYGTVAATLVFAPGVTTRTFEIEIISDGIDEPDETVVLTFGSVQEAQPGSVDQAVLTIVGGGSKVYLPLAVRHLH